MEIRPGPVPIRQRLLDLALAQQPPFGGPDADTQRPMEPHLPAAGSDGREAGGSDAGRAEEEIRKAWEVFLKTDLPVIREVIRSGAFGIGEDGSDG